MNQSLEAPSMNEVVAREIPKMDPSRSVLNKDEYKTAVSYEIEHKDRQYSYGSMDEMPPAHRKIAIMYAKRFTAKEIAAHLKMTPQTIAKILSHPPVAQMVALIQSHEKLLFEKAREDLIVASRTAFDYSAKVVTGDEEPNKVRFDAAKDLMDRDPLRRFDPDAPQNQGAEPFVGDTLHEFIDVQAHIEEKARRRTLNNAIEAKDTDDDALGKASD